MNFQFNERKFSVQVNKNKIESIAIFGSHIHGDADEKSDIDMFIVVENMSSSEKERVRGKIAKEMKVPISWIDIYTKKELANHCKNGSFYFWELRLNRRVMYTKTNYTQTTLEKMPIYKKVKKSLQSFHQTIQASMQAFYRGYYTPERMLNHLAHFIRKIFIEITYMHGFFLSDRTKPVEICFASDEVKMPFSRGEWEKLYDLKREYKSSGRFMLKGDKKAYVRRWYHYFTAFYHEALRMEKVKMNETFVSPLRSYVR